MDEAHGYEARIQARASRLYHEHERSFSLFLFPPPYVPLHVVKFFRDGHQRRGQIWAFVPFVWNLRPISGPFFHLERSTTTNPSFFLSACFEHWRDDISKSFPLFVSIRSSLHCSPFIRDYKFICRNLNIGGRYDLIEEDRILKFYDKRISFVSSLFLLFLLMLIISIFLWIFVNHHSLATSS